MRQIDIRGKVCPMTFVYTKLAIEELEKGEILEVVLDFPAALKSIPENCKRQCLAEVVQIKKTDQNKASWILKLKRI
jgi:tRNA 2-thiouridine synthesizing protein A